MAKKKVVELTPEQKLQQEKEHALLSVKENLRYLNEPTYSFAVGDEVKYGAMKKAVVEQVLEGGKAYLLLCIATNNNYGNPYDYETYRGVYWMDIRPLETKETDFTKQSAIRLNFQNSTVESIIHRKYHFGVDMNPDYQRDFVWTAEDKEYLIDSIFKGVDIGKFVFVVRPMEEWHKDFISYEILDGKQRLNALIEFYENRFPYKGVYYNELSHKDKRTFTDHTVSLAEVRDASKKEVLESFLLLNRCGHVMNKAQLEKVEEMIKEM